MSMVIQSFDNLHDNRVLRYCADFEAHTLHMDTQTETGEKVSVRFTGLLAHWFENVIQDNILDVYKRQDKEIRVLRAAIAWIRPDSFLLRELPGN